MADQLLDIHLDFDLPHLSTHRDATRLVYEASQRAATEAATRQGATLRHPDPRETVVKQAIDPLTGRDALLVSTRWVIDGATTQG